MAQLSSRIGSLLVGLVSLCILVPPALARNCTEEERTTADKQLWLNKRDKQTSLNRHLPWGPPQPTEQVKNEKIYVHWDYVINYDSDLRVPIWTAHRLDAEGLGNVGRVDCFRKDPRIGASAASTLADYREPIFDQGHMTPNGDVTSGLNPVINSFVMSNMTPQYCQFNRGVWQILESIVRLWAREKEAVYVLTGSVFDRDGDGKRDADSSAKRMKSNSGKTRVAVPSHFYKILVHQRSDGTVELLAILLPHNQTEVDGDEALKYLEDHIRSVGEVEGVTGLTFFPGVPSAGAAAKAVRASSLWPIVGAPSKSLVFDPCRKTAGADQ